MAVQGVQKLPIGIDIHDSLLILDKLSMVTNKIGRLDEKFDSSIVNTGLIQLLSLSESVQSTRIEGIQVTFTDMIEEKDDIHPRSEITEVNNYQQALLSGFEQVRHGYPITTSLVQNLHHILMTDGRRSIQSKGAFRKIQNFIGPTNPIEDATYIPVAANQIDEYMQNWEYFINGHPYGKKLPISDLNQKQYFFDENSNPLIKAAILHAQFESIHPFLDGNGRLGRILIVLYLVQSKHIKQPVFFVSEELEREKARYYDLLNGVRGENPDWGSWILFFLKACDRMSDHLMRQLNNAETLANDGLMSCETESQRKVWLYTFSNPSATVRKTAAATNLSTNTARTALNHLVNKGLLFSDKHVKRNKKYRNYDLLSALR